LTTIIIYINFLDTTQTSLWFFRMYVCLCKGVTDSQIRSAVENGASIRDIRDQLGVMTECGKCACLTKDIVRSSRKESGESDLFWAVA
jgi:bacterioferritin-associated ferredoxin